MRSRVACLVVLLAVVLVPGATAQETPTADSLIHGYVQAIGGRDAHTTPTSIRTTGTVEMAAMGLSGDFELLQYAPDRMLLRLSVPGVGEILNGFDGEVGWSVDPLSGPRVLQGEELEVSRERAHLLAAVRDRSLVPERETVELVQRDGEACWRVRLVWASGRESFDCYSDETGLLIASEDEQVSQMGVIEVTTTYEDYEEFEGGMRLPTRMVQRAMGQVQEMRVDEVRLNALEPDAVEAPAAIRTLLDP